jgi:hypothetical protein
MPDNHLHESHRQDRDISWTLGGRRRILFGDWGTDFRDPFMSDISCKIGRIYSIPSQHYMRNMLSQLCKNSMTIGSARKRAKLNASKYLRVLGNFHI